MASRISNLASLSLYLISDTLPIFEFRGVNIEFSEFIAIFDIIKSKFHGGHFVAPYSIFGHKMNVNSNIPRFDIYRQLNSNMPYIRI